SAVGEFGNGYGGLLVTTAPTVCVVPTVVGKTLNRAERAIVRAHCALGKVRNKASRTVAPGHIVSQSPAAARHLAGGSRVNVVLSTGLPHILRYVDTSRTVKFPHEKRQ